MVVVEQRERNDSRLETLRRLAAASRASTTGLITERYEHDPAQDAVARWEPVRQALDAPAGQDDLDDPPTIAGVSNAVDAALPLFSGDRFVELSMLCPL